MDLWGGGAAAAAAASEERCVIYCRACTSVLIQDPSSAPLFLLQAAASY
eukprot:COSAG01_NODE_70776_length_257_cov_2.259494_1_plen_48_part_10